MSEIKRAIPIHEVLNRELQRQSTLLSLMPKPAPPTRWQKFRRWVRDHTPYFHVSWGYKDWQYWED